MQKQAQHPDKRYDETTHQWVELTPAEIEARAAEQARAEAAAKKADEKASKKTTSDSQPAAGQE